MDTSLYREFYFLIDQNTGSKLEKIIEQVLDSNILNINNLFLHKNIQAINEPINSNKFYNTLSLFNTGTYATYKANTASYIELTDRMLTKLRILTLIDLSKDSKTLNLVNLMKILDISDSFELDRLIFECNSSGVIIGKINQKEKLFKILTVSGRDNLPDIYKVKYKMNKWYENVLKAEEFLEEQIQKARNQTKEYNKNIEDLEISKKKAQNNKEIDSRENMETRTNKMV